MIRSSLPSLVVLALAGTASAFGQAADATRADPTHHLVILENEQIRVIEARASAGARSPVHSHPPLALVSLDRARGRFTMPDGSTAFLDLLPGQVLWMGEPFEHSWELLAGEVHVIAVEVKAARSGRPPAPVALPANDAAKVDPAHHQVVLENDWVRVISNLASPGAKSPMHSHPDIAVISLGRARFRLTSPDGTSQIADFHPGQVVWFQNVVHSWELLSGEANLIGVEIKRAR